MRGFLGAREYHTGAGQGCSVLARASPRRDLARDLGAPAPDRAHERPGWPGLQVEAGTGRARLTRAVSARSSSRTCVFCGYPALRVFFATRNGQPLAPKDPPHEAPKGTGRSFQGDCRLSRVLITIPGPAQPDSAGTRCPNSDGGRAGTGARFRPVRCSSRKLYDGPMHAISSLPPGQVRESSVHTSTVATFPFHV